MTEPDIWNSWRPADWTRSDDYPNAEANLGPERWAWEFLRRNADYQNDCKKAFLTVSDKQKEVALRIGIIFDTDVDEDLRSKLQNYGLEWFIMPFHNETSIAFTKRNIVSVQRFRGEEQRAIGSTDGVTVNCNFIPLYPKSDNELVFKVYLDRDIDQQLHELRHTIHRAKDLLPATVTQRSIRVEGKKFPTYLQLLDAFWSGETKIPQIARKLAQTLDPTMSDRDDDYFDKMDRLVKRLEKGASRARTLSESGYLLLL
ncbi:MAG: hypothetical protein K2X93_27225 [Candidatus Obscuribacterales bacterium]|nr:hypothetical protein [Candidatus Obscuribacterales bacterium]